MTTDNIGSPSDQDTPSTTPDSPERRAALEKLAAMTAWTTPTMMLLLRSKRASAASTFTGTPPSTPGGEG